MTLTTRAVALIATAYVLALVAAWGLGWWYATIGRYDGCTHAVVGAVEAWVCPDRPVPQPASGGAA